jgi:hypothetical protein
MKKFDELEKIVKKHFPNAKWDEKQQAWLAVTRPNSKDQWDQPETMVTFDKEASKKFYSYMSSNSWDNEGNIQIGVRKNIFENYMKHIHTFESFIAESSLNYGQAMELANLQDIVKKHIKDKYSDLYYGNNNILGKLGRDIPETSWKKIEKLAKDKEDKDLETAISNYKDLSSKYKGK